MGQRVTEPQDPREPLGPQTGALQTNSSKLPRADAGSSSEILDRNLPMPLNEPRNRFLKTVEWSRLAQRIFEPSDTFARRTGFSKLLEKAPSRWPAPRVS